MGGSGSPAVSATSSMASSMPAEHIQTIGVRRKGFGTAGTAVKVYTNHFAAEIPREIIYHYDGTP